LKGVSVAFNLENLTTNQRNFFVFPCVRNRGECLLGF